MKPFFIAIFIGLKNFFGELWTDGNVFLATIGFIMQVLAALGVIFFNFSLYFPLGVFALGLLFFYVGVIAWAVKKKKGGSGVVKSNTPKTTAKLRGSWTNAKK